jgi:hypothetical protein
MLAEKLASMRATFAALVNAESSTPRLLAQARGKAAHYGCAVQHLAAVCPSLTQAMHQAESEHCLPPPNLAEEAQDDHFDWDQPLRLSTRTRAALALLLRITDQLGSAGQPMWPVSPIVMSEEFQKGINSIPTLPTIVALSHVTHAGWGWALRAHAEDQPLLLHGSWAAAPALLGADWMAQPTFEASGAPRSASQRQALAALLGLHAASRHRNLSASSLIIRTSGRQAIHALQHGDSKDPALQDISMLFQTACLELRLRRPAFLEYLNGAHPSPSSPSSHPRQGLARGGGYGHSNTDVCRSQRPAGHITGGGTGGGGQQPGHPTNKRATGEGEKGGGRRPGCRQGPARSACGDGGSIRRAQGGYWNARGTDGNRLTLRSRHQRL